MRRLSIFGVILFATVFWIVRLYEGYFGERAAEQIASAAMTEWQKPEMQLWVERLGCQEEIGPLVNGELVKPILVRLVACAERRLQTCER